MSTINLPHITKLAAERVLARKAHTDRLERAGKTASVDPVASLLVEHLDAKYGLPELAPLIELLAEQLRAVQLDVAAERCEWTADLSQLRRRLLLAEQALVELRRWR